MGRIGRRATAAVAGVVILAAATAACAAGYNIQEQSVQGLGRAYSGEAAAVGADSLWWNPAAIAEVDGVEVYNGAHLVLSRSDIVDEGSTITRPGQPTAPVGGDPRAPDAAEPGLIANFDAAWRVNQRLALGLAVSAPFGLTIKYAPDSFLRYQALTSKLQDIDLQPTLAIHAAPWLDLGAGFDAQYANATLSEALPNLSPLLPDAYERLHGTGWNIGWSAGAQVRPVPRLVVGLSYRSAIAHELGGSVTVNGLLGPLAPFNSQGPGQALFSTPWFLVLGARYALDARWTLDGEIQQAGWSRFRDIEVRTSAGTSLLPQDYHDTTREALGFDWAARPDLTLRAGVAHDPTPTPDIGRTARVPDGDRWLFTVGATLRPRPRLELYTALAYVDIARSALVDQSIAFAGTPAATPLAYDAEATGEAFVLAVGGKMKF